MKLKLTAESLGVWFMLILQCCGISIFIYVLWQWYPLFTLLFINAILWVIWLAIQKSKESIKQ